MNRPIRVSLVFAALALTAVVHAQESSSSAEFGRASGGSLELISKQPSRFSGSLGLTLSASASPFATVGGTAIKDRLWFFASAQRNETRAQLPQQLTAARALDAHAIAQLGARQTLSAFAESGAQSAPLGLRLPSSFLSLHYTGIVSPSMFFQATVSQRATGGASILPPGN